MPLQPHIYHLFYAKTMQADCFILYPTVPPIPVSKSHPNNKPATITPTLPKLLYSLKYFFNHKTQINGFFRACCGIKLFIINLIFK